MRRRPVCAALLAVCALVGGTAACGSDDDPPRPSAAETSTTTTLSEEAAEAQAGVTLDDAGSEPRETLRLRVPAGTTTRTALVTELTMRMTLDGEPVPIGAVPTTRLALEQRADRVDPDGTVHYSVGFTDASVVPTPGVSAEVAQETQKALGQIKGIRGTGSFDAFGANQTASFDTSGVSDPTLKSTMDSTASQVSNLSAPFPRRPVGPGARWTVRRTATINGITMNTETHYTLRSRTGDRYQLDVGQEAEAPPGPAVLPNLPARASASIERFTMRNTGMLTGDLTRLVPEESTMTGEGDGELAFTEGGATGRLVQHLTMDLTLSPA